MADPAVATPEQVTVPPEEVRPMWKMLRRWYGLRLAHEAILADDAQRVLKDARDATRAHNARIDSPDFGEAVSQQREQAAEDAMGIHVGDVYYPPQAAPVQVVAQPEPRRQSVIGAVARAAIGAGLIATGAGAGAGAMILAEALRGKSAPQGDAPPQTTIIQPAGSDAYRLRLWRPAETE